MHASTYAIMYAVMYASMSAFWNQLLPSTRSTLLTGEPSTSFLSLRLLSSLWVSLTGKASDFCALQEALYKCIDTIQYNTIFKYMYVCKYECKYVCKFICKYVCKYVCNVSIQAVAQDQSLS